jgi:hypothetical protein
MEGEGEGDTEELDNSPKTENKSSNPPAELEKKKGADKLFTSLQPEVNPPSSSTKPIQEPPISKSNPFLAFQQPDKSDSQNPKTTKATKNPTLTQTVEQPKVQNNQFEDLSSIHEKLINLVELAQTLQPLAQKGNLINVESMQASPGKTKQDIEENKSTGLDQNNVTIDATELIGGAMVKFDNFWTEVLKKYEKVTNSNMNPNVPEFEKLFKSLTKPEKKNFKPFLKILAHSLQFCDKMFNLDYKLESLKNELKTAIDNQNTGKSKLLENQIIKLQKNCQDFINSEEMLKRQLQYMQEKNKELDDDINKAAKDLLDYK